MEERPRCPTCDDVLIEGECVQHGVVVERALDPMPTEGEPRPTERAHRVTPAGGGPSYVVFEPESVARERERQMAEAAAANAPSTEATLTALPDADPEPGPAGGREPARAPAPGSQDTVVIDQKPLLFAGVAAVVLLVFVLVALWQGQRSVAARLDAVRASVDALDDRLTQAETFEVQAEARLDRIQKQIGDTVNLTSLAKKVTPAVFTIRTSDGVGSGFVVKRTTSSSTLLTNLHVVVGAGPNGRVLVDQKGRRTLQGRIGKIDPENDLAAVIVNRRLPILPMLRRVPSAGDQVIAVGSPLGLGGTVTEGIVSGRVQGLIQFSAPASPGSSGGPLVNAKGQVIGIVTLKLVDTGAEGLAFAVPSSAACSRILTC